MRQIIDERDTGKSWYFAITEFSNCLIIRSPSLLFHEYLREAFIFTQDRSQKGKKRGLISFTAHEQKIILSQTQFNDIAHEQVIFCWQLFAGHVMGSWQTKRKKNLHRMIVQCHLISFNNYNSSYFKEKGKYRYFNHSPSSDSMSRVFLTLTIRHLHISHNTFCLPPSHLQKHCLQFLLVGLLYPGEIKNKDYAKFGRGGGQNKLRYGWCVSFEWQRIRRLFSRGGGRVTSFFLQLIDIFA